MRKICVFIADSNGRYPVPASKGSAVSTLVELFVAGNEERKLLDMTVVSYFDEQAVRLSKKYPTIKFIWIKTPWMLRMVDKVIYRALSNFKKVHATSFLSFTALIHYTLKSSAILRKGHFDIALLEHNIPMIWMMKWSGFKGKYFHHLHNIPRTNAKCKWGISRCDGFICISQFMAEEIMSKHNPIGPVPASKIHLLYNTIDTNLFKPIPDLDTVSLRKKLGLATDSKILIFTGRLTWEKGIDKLLESLDFLETANVEVLIVGSISFKIENTSSYEIELKAMAEKYKNIVHFTGYIEHAELPKLYNLADIAVLPSMWEEPAGLTMLEAMACGTPVITTKSGGIPEYVGDSAIVLTRNTQLPQNIAKAIDSLLSNKHQYEDLRSKGIKRIRLNFDSSNYINQLANVIS